jgi:hypothetical protein
VRKNGKHSFPVFGQFNLTHYPAGGFNAGNRRERAEKFRSACHSMTPAMSAGVSEKLCSMTDPAEMVDATVAKPCKRGRRPDICVSAGAEHWSQLMRLAPHSTISAREDQIYLTFKRGSKGSDAYSR